MSRPLAYWMAAALLAVGLVVMHLFSGAWVTRVFPELYHSITDPTPLSLGAKAFMLAYLALSVGLAVGVPLCIFEALLKRDQRRWQHEETKRQRQWALQRQLQEVEQRLYEESLPDWQREAIQESRHRRAEVRREARRRLGLPDDEEAP
jgi:hypothetical protein